MKVKELIKELKMFDENTDVLVSSDEELNTLYHKFEVAKLTDRENSLVIYGLSGCEVDDSEFLDNEEWF